MHLRPDLKLIAFFMLLPGMTACAVYDKYGHGIVVRSKLAADEATPVVLPANAPTISQRYLPGDVASAFEHKGFDILVPHRTPVLAAADAIVARVSLSLLYGKQVYLNHTEPQQGLRLQTRYFHLSERLVEEGQAVERGQVIGYSGATGMAGVYPHLHFEVHSLDDSDPPIAQGHLDPQLFWAEGVGRVTCFDRSAGPEPIPPGLTYPVPCRDVDWD